MDIKQATQIIMCYALWTDKTSFHAWENFERENGWPKDTISDAWEVLENEVVEGLSLMPKTVARTLEQ